MIARAILQAFNAGTYLATLTLDNGLSTIANVPCSTAIASGLLVAGANVAVVLFDPSNPADALVIGVFP